MKKGRRIIRFRLNRSNFPANMEKAQVSRRTVSRTKLGLSFEIERAALGHSPAKSDTYRIEQGIELRGLANLEGRRSKGRSQRKCSEEDSDKLHGER
jgi:hypothetical protein